ncbi:MAG: luciferase family protein [Friedmanniella sp.]|nr:luciferase family protein [Friedmanniella sp.]
MSISRLSVLDLVPVRQQQSTRQALAASVALARVAEANGVHRYWVAEHHNMPAVASTNPPVIIGLLAAATQRMRIGSGGMMLPNHAPLVVAEQFALLEAAYPGRIDLGIGRAPGSDPVTSWALRHGGPSTGDADRFEEHVSNLIAMMAPEGVGLQVQGRSYGLKATPLAGGVPTAWLLGSSDYSARLAAQLGLPYVFAHHFSGEGTEAALHLYRSTFQPSAATPVPQTFLTANVVVAETEEEAERLVRPQLLAMISLRTGGALLPQLSVEEAERTPIAGAHTALAEQMRSRWVVGTPVQAAAQLAELAATYGVEEIMVNPVAAAYETDALDRSANRETTLELLAAELFAPVG